MIDAGLQGRVALVTGGNQGIGAAAVRALAAQGAAVFITYLRLGNDDPGVQATELAGYADARAQSAEALVDEITNAGGRVAAFEADLADPTVIPGLFDRAEETLGPVEILFNNADTWVADTFLPDAKDDFVRKLVAVTAATHDHSFSVNSRATALLIAEFAHRHVARGADWGRIISMTSGGEGGFAREVSYGASKNALESYTQAAAWELGKYGITANILYPPPTDTGWITSEMAAQFASEGPLYHVGQPDEVAEVVLFLASHQARFVTGQKIRMF
ncbi:MAG: SDR family NAD(P)-dependent oxidoreductase [Thermomicrobiales bacterium]